MITVTFPDGNKKAYEKGVSSLDVASSISEGLARECVACVVDGVVVDMLAALEKDCSVEFLKFSDSRAKEVFWHTSAHVLAQAVLRLFPDALPTIGPPIEQGFYYDFANLSLKQEDLSRIEEEMKKVVKEDFSPQRVEHSSIKEVEKLYGHNAFKMEIAREYEDSGLSSYKQGEFIDLCKGPHLPRLGMIKALKLTKLSGAYWRGDAANEQLTRIYGISFPDKKQLKQYLTLLEEAAKRDHRKLGSRLDLFGFDDSSPGSAFFYPNGTVVYNEFLSFLREEYKKRGYQEVITPLMYAKELWEQSGHWEHYKEDMFVLEESQGKTYSLKPMNCPSHCIIYNRTQYSYRDLPVRIADFAPLHRNELTGTLSGLTRVRKLSQDDAHIFCTVDQIQSEIADLIDFAKYIYEDVVDMSFDHVELSTRPEKFLGEVKDWDVAESALKSALESQGMRYVLNEGDGAFYGPKIDFHIRDALGRTWQTATIQLDFQLPERFGCVYQGEDSKKHSCVMIHRALLGSLERFLAVFIENCAGKLPLWCSPQQVRVLPITDAHASFAQEVAASLQKESVRVRVDSRSESLNKKIREAQLDYVPYILVVGDKEVSDNSVNVRTRDNEVHGTIGVDDFVKKIVSEITNKK
ncbi:MAG: threonine--tRNA ligase [Candidatus Woesearchaeota archaeon]